MGWYPGKALGNDWLGKDADAAAAEAEARRQAAIAEAEALGGHMPGMGRADTDQAREDYVRRKAGEYADEYHRGPGEERMEQWRREAEQVHPYEPALDSDRYMVGDDHLLGPSQTAQNARRYENIYGQIYNQGGMDEITRAENEMARRQYDQHARAQRQAALQRLSARGMGGSGAQMSAQLQGGQSAADAAYQARLGNLAEGRQRALQALGQAAKHGTLAGASVDEFNRNNVQYRRDVDRNNTAYLRELPWRQYEAQERLAGMKAGYDVFGSQQSQSYAQQAQQASDKAREDAVGLVGTVLEYYD